MKTKRGTCPRCCPTGGAIFENDVKVTYTTDDLNEKGTVTPIWRCANCHLEQPRRTVDRTKQRTAPSPSQAKALERWKARHTWTSPSRNPDFDEILREESMDFHGRVMLWKGTIGPRSRAGALFLCDKRYLLRVGSNGHIDQLYPTPEKKGAKP